MKYLFNIFENNFKIKIKTMASKFTDFIKNNISKSMMNISIPAFFSLLLTCFSGYKTYNDKEKFNAILKINKEVDDIKTKLKDESILSHREIKYGELNLKIYEHQEYVTPIILKAINKDKYVKKDSIKYFISQLNAIHDELPEYIGRLKAHSQLDVLGTNEEKVINLELLKSEYILSKDLANTFKNNKKENEENIENINNFWIAYYAFETFHTDSLYMINRPEINVNPEQIKNDLVDTVKTYNIWRLIYLLGIILSSTLLLLLIFFFIKFDYHK